MRNIFLAILACLCIFAAIPAQAYYGADNGTVLTSPQNPIGGRDDRETWYFNATMHNNSTGVVAELPFLEWTQCKMWAEPGPTYNSASEQQAWTTPASGSIVYVAEVSRNMVRNQTVGSFTLASPSPLYTNGTARAYYFYPSGLMDNRTATVHGLCWGR